MFLRQQDDLIEQGIEQEKIEIAENLLLNHVDINVIVSSTGLSIEQIENIKQALIF